MRRTALKRKTPLRKRRDRPRRVAPDRIRSDEHRARVRALGVCLGHHPPGWECGGIVTASHNDHDGTKGMGLKTSDLTCVPMRWKCHMAWTDNNGPYKGWDLGTRRLWFAGLVRLTAELLSGGPRRLVAERVPF